MLSSVLRSDRAVMENIEIMRAFVRLAPRAYTSPSIRPPRVTRGAVGLEATPSRRMGFYAKPRHLEMAGGAIS